MQTTAAPSVPTAGTPAYWQAQREAVALFSALREHLDDAEHALPVLRQIAAHGRARQLLAAHGHDADQLLRSCEGCLAMWQGDEEDGGDDADDEDLVGDTNEPPPGEDWCPRGCQPLFRMDCGMCGYAGHGVWADAVSTVAEYCCHCRARTYQGHDGTCELCGRNAEGDDEPPPASPPAARLQRPGCDDAGIACCLLSYLDGHARLAMAQAEAGQGRAGRGRHAPGPARTPPARTTAAEAPTRAATACACVAGPSPLSRRIRPTGR